MKTQVVNIICTETNVDRHWLLIDSNSTLFIIHRMPQTTSAKTILAVKHHYHNFLNLSYDRLSCNNFFGMAISLIRFHDKAHPALPGRYKLRLAERHIAAHQKEYLISPAQNDIIWRNTG